MKYNNLNKEQLIELIEARDKKIALLSSDLGEVMGRFANLSSELGEAMSKLSQVFAEDHNGKPVFEGDYVWLCPRNASEPDMSSKILVELVNGFLSIPFGDGVMPLHKLVDFIDGNRIALFWKASAGKEDNSL